MTPARPSSPWWVRASWMCPAISFGGNLAMSSLTPSLEASGGAPMLLFAISLIWVLFAFAGFGFGVASIIGAIVKHQPRWAIEGAIGVVVPAFFVTWAVIAISHRH